MRVFITIAINRCGMKSILQKTGGMWHYRIAYWSIVSKSAVIKIHASAPALLPQWILSIITLVSKCTWLPAWWALWLLWWPLTDAAMFQCVYGYLQSVFFFLVLFYCCILLEIKLTTTTTTSLLGKLWQFSVKLKLHSSIPVVFLMFIESMIILGMGSTSERKC